MNLEKFKELLKKEAKKEPHKWHVSPYYIELRNTFETKYKVSRKEFDELLTKLSLEYLKKNKFLLRDGCPLNAGKYEEEWFYFAPEKRYYYYLIVSNL